MPVDGAPGRSDPLLSMASRGLDALFNFTPLIYLIAGIAIAIPVVAKVLRRSEVREIVI